MKHRALSEFSKLAISASTAGNNEPSALGEAQGLSFPR